jgi:hypothetical protein
MRQRSIALQVKYESILETRKQHPDIPIAKFCKEQGITPWTYYYWKKRLRTSVSPVCSSSNFIPLSIIPPRHLAGKISCEIIFPNGCRFVTKDALEAGMLPVILRTVAKIPS